jgi:hypothetical protein
MGKIRTRPAAGGRYQRIPQLTAWRCGSDGAAGRGSECPRKESSRRHIPAGLFPRQALTYRRSTFEKSQSGATLIHDEQLLAQSAEHGAVRTIEKPFTPEALVAEQLERIRAVDGGSEAALPPSELTSQKRDRQLLPPFRFRA